MRKLCPPSVWKRLKKEGTLLKTRRENLGLSRQVVANAIERSASLIQHIEEGRDNNFTVIEQLHKYYDFVEGTYER